MLEYLTSNQWLFWLIISLLCLIMEMASGTFYILCFAIGALFSMVGSWLGFPFLAQVVCFACFSILSIFAVRPMALKYLHRGEEERKSNADALEGREGVVIEEVQPQRSGYVKVDGDEWRAVSADGSLIKRGEKVRIVKMESIVATVERV